MGPDAVSREHMIAPPERALAVFLEPFAGTRAKKPTVGYHTLWLRLEAGGLVFAVPEQSVVAIMPGILSLKPLAGAPVWLKGRTSKKSDGVAVVDLPYLARDGEGVSASGPLLLLADGRVALHCDEVADSFRLKTEAVVWRGPTGRRPWMAGVCQLDEGCILLDVDNLILMCQAALS